MSKEAMYIEFEQGKVIQSCEDANTEYLETPDGLRLIFREHEYSGWYLPGGDGNG